MTPEVALRATAVVLALLFARGTGNRAAAFATGVLAGFAVFGARAPSMPSAFGAALLAACLVTLVAIVAARAWPLITGDGLSAGALAATGAACAAAVSGRHLPGWQDPALFAIAFAVVSAFAAEATRASAEAGWREAIAWTSALLVPVLLAAVLASLFS
ncbi:MAG TPA: hypothetical protein VF425_00235, partial [Thermoanaerobaculia bacterium]